MKLGPDRAAKHALYITEACQRAIEMDVSSAGKLAPFGPVKWFLEGRVPVLTEIAARLSDLSRCFLNHYHKGKAKGQVKGEILATLGLLFQASPEV